MNYNPANDKRRTHCDNYICLFQYLALSEVFSIMGHGDLGRLYFGIPF